MPRTLEALGFGPGRIVGDDAWYLEEQVSYLESDLAEARQGGRGPVGARALAEGDADADGSAAVVGSSSA